MYLYFCLIGSEGDLNGNHSDLGKFCQATDMKLVKFDKLSQGHIPGYREVLISGNEGQIRALLDYMKEDGSFPIVENPHHAEITEADLG